MTEVDEDGNIVTTKYITVTETIIVDEDGGEAVDLAFLVDPDAVDILDQLIGEGRRCGERACERAGADEEEAAGCRDGCHRAGIIGDGRFAEG